MPLKLEQTLSGHTDRVWTLAWNPSGTLLASSGADKDIRMWAKQGEQWLCVSILRDTHDKSIRRLCWSPCGRYLASASFDSTVCLWRKESDEKSWTTVMNLEGHETEVKSVAWSHDGQYLASCGRDRTVWIWERAANDDGDVDDAENWDCSDIRNDHTKDVKHIVWHPTENILVSCSYDDTLKFFHKDGHDWKCYQTLASHTSTVWSAAFSATGEFLASAGDDKTVRVWKNHAHDKLPNVDPSSWKCISTIQGYHNRTIYDLSWCKYTDTIVSASGDNSLVFYSKTRDEISGEDMFICIDKFSQAHDCDINSVSWNTKADGLLATAGDDRLIKVWNFDKSAKGMRQPTIVEDIIRKLKLTSLDSISHENQDPESELTSITVTDFQNLTNLIQSLQLLQNELQIDEERISVEKLFDLDIKDPNMEPVEVASLQVDDVEGIVEQFQISVKDSQGLIVIRLQVIIHRSQFKLFLPRRSAKFTTIGDAELFVFEKTGDLFKILPSGKTEFQLGHLFTFSDVKFVGSEKTKYVISADRDEKIRVSRYPNTYEIESYCFGHKHFIRRLLVANGVEFVSIDQENNAILWNLSCLEARSNQDFVKPVRVAALGENPLKRARTAA